jgi:hypothetical protein
VNGRGPLLKSLLTVICMAYSSLPHKHSLPHDEDRRVLMKRCHIMPSHDVTGITFLRLWLPIQS